MISVLKDSIVNSRQNAEEIPISFGNLIKKKENEKGKEPYESRYHMREPMFFVSTVSTLLTSCPQVIKELASFNFHSFCKFVITR